MMKPQTLDAPGNCITLAVEATLVAPEAPATKAAGFTFPSPNPVTTSIL